MNDSQDARRRQVGILNALKDRGFVTFVFFSVLVAIAFGLISALLPNDKAPAFLISLTILIISLIIELRVQIADAKEELKEHLAEAKSDLDGKLRLAEQTIATAVGLQARDVVGRFPVERVGQIVESYTRIPETNTFFLARANELIKDCADQMAKFQAGRMEVRPIDIYFHTRLCLKQASSTVFATSIARIKDFWLSEGGLEYLRENVDAARRGVKITRVFILDNAADLNQRAGNGRVRDIIAWHMDGGITVLIAFKRALKDEWRHDMAVFDDKYVEYLNVETRGALFHSTEAELRIARDIQKNIMDRSEEARLVLARTLDSRARDGRSREGERRR